MFRRGGIIRAARQQASSAMALLPPATTPMTNSCVFARTGPQQAPRRFYFDSGEELRLLQGLIRGLGISLRRTRIDRKRRGHWFSHRGDRRRQTLGRLRGGITKADLALAGFGSTAGRPHDVLAGPHKSEALALFGHAAS